MLSVCRQYAFIITRKASIEWIHWENKSNEVMIKIIRSEWIHKFWFSANAIWSLRETPASVMSAIVHEADKTFVVTLSIMSTCERSVKAD